MNLGDGAIDALARPHFAPMEDEFLGDGRKGVPIHLLFLSKQKVKKYGNSVKQILGPQEQGSGSAGCQPALPRFTISRVRIRREKSLCGRSASQGRSRKGKTVKSDRGIGSQFKPQTATRALPVALSMPVTIAV